MRLQVRDRLSVDEHRRALERRDAQGDLSAREPLRRALVRSGEPDPFALLVAALREAAFVQDPWGSLRAPCCGNLLSWSPATFALSNFNPRQFARCPMPRFRSCGRVLLQLTLSAAVLTAGDGVEPFRREGELNLTGGGNYFGPGSPPAFRGELHVHAVRNLIEELARAGVGGLRVSL